MAQAFFDEHPVGDYLRDAGENQFSIPGISSDLERELDPNFDCSDDDDDDDELLPEWRPRLLVEFMQILQSVISVAHSNSAPSPFVERFRYNVISSSLLSPSLSAHHTPRPSKSFPIPGKLHHSRTSSMDDANPPLVTPLRATQIPDSSVGVVSLTATVAAVFLSFGYPALSLLSLFPTVFFMFNPFATSDTPKHDMSLTYNALEDLLSANESWESTVQDTINTLEVEERSLRITTSSLVSSPIRVALHSCLQSTHMQCDNIRHLFSALTSPTELSQLAEMYAPPSPVKTAFSTEMAARPFSYPSAHLSPPFANDSSSPSTPSKKRFTWNGSYLSLADAGSPTNLISRRRERQSTQLREIFEVGNSSAELVSPFSKGGPEDAEDGEKTKSDTHDSSSSQFGAAALDLRRKRRSVGLDALRSPPMTVPEVRTSRGFRNSMLFSPNASSSKFTNPLPARHPLSFTALTFSLQGAMAAKRYSCSHLLALRFSDVEDDGYWEDVRSVIGLLTSALVDASSRLSEALDEREQQKIAEGKPTPEETRVELEEAGQDDSTYPTSVSHLHDTQTLANGFAPMPNHISRFAAHIAAITSAMDDARDHLGHCVSALKAGQAEPAKLSFMSASQRRLGHVRSLSRPYFAGNGDESKEEEEEEPKALQAYERLRRELGLALRECERGRERLLEIVYPPPPILSDDEEEEEDLPALGHDLSDESDKLDPISPRSETGDTEVRPVAQVINPTGGGVDSVDDVTAHLLLTSTTQHLPLPGIEEVFEAETGPITPFLRERPKLSREERIKLARSRRESGGGNRYGLGLSVVEGPEAESKSKIELWGPGGDVVQELKDVIWKVGERKRKLTLVAQATEQEQDPFLDPMET